MTATVFPKSMTGPPRLPPQRPSRKDGAAGEFQGQAPVFDTYAPAGEQTRSKIGACPEFPRAAKEWPNHFRCDEEIIRKAQLGDAEAWEVLVRQNVGWIFGYCRRWVGSVARAEDLTQEVFLRIFQNLDSYRGEMAGFHTWVNRLTRNLLVDDYRRTRSERFTLSYDSDADWMRSALASLPSDAINPEAGFKQKERKAFLHEAFRRLDPHHRKAVVMHDLLDMTYEEISSMLQTPVGTVKSRVNRGRIELVALVRQRMALHGGFGSGTSAAV